MELLTYLRTHKNWREELTSSPYNLSIQEKDGYYLFKYNMVKSDFTYPLVSEARGSIFYYDGEDWECVCRAFDKFWNAEERFASSVNWATASVQEKLDGSIVKAWYHKGEWHWSTNGTIDAGEATTTSLLYPTYMDLIDEALSVYGGRASVERWMFSNFTYIFELVSPYNKIVVDYPDTKLYFLGWRDMVTMKEIEPFHCEVYYKMPHPLCYPLTNYNAVMDYLKDQTDREGFVVCDGNFERVKIKTEWYVMYHKLCGGRTPTLGNIVELILAGEVSEFLAYFPEYEMYCRRIQAILLNASLTAHIATMMLARVTFDTKKQFASYIKENIAPEYVDYCFKWYDRGITWEEYTGNWSTNKWVKFVESQK